ncbi:aspartyl/asparaginyl beta-hydroxylase isoform X2 [Lucilia sericata]|uniref:aspartyl/asparaginyl beta-hydroxylase isoform X2 n=1 Tax=Lucilia sericata TaxID=13632 RepID=UPI0018A83D3A|nr:aspartyl/asparaginyl beta-hydroxylase isoform X2 [Lucilia sericata]XP_037823164.1 aspartyl/asparaginyl beta-hydroxylase isoform X2 [Lucilia sericata]
MSGDVQPRKRKDKKKKRDDEASHGVHITKMGSDDVHLHIHEEHGTGGNWCAKTIFFSLMLLLLSVVCIIIMENRGISDVDTPLSESRFSNYFDGWVDEHRAEHDDHHDSHGSLEHDDDHDDEHDEEDDHDEPFEEEADHSEGDEEIEEEEEEDENVTPEEEDEDQDDNATAENVTAEEEDEDEEEDEENVTAEEDVDDNITAEEADDDNVTAEDENVTEEATMEQNDDDEDDEEDVNKTNEQDDEDDNVTKETSKPTSQDVQDDDDEEDDDGNFDSLEKIVDNDASELELLKEKARQQAAAESSKQNAASAENDLEDEADNAPSWASSMAVKIGVGLALALVARLVLIRKNPISNEAPAPEILMKRRLTIASPDELIPEDVDNAAEPLPEEDYSEEEIEIEEEIEYIEEEIETVGEENQVDAEIKPKTGGGPQSLEDDDDIDLFEQELRRANEEMMREHYEDALKSFDRLIQTYPHQPQTYLGKAQTLDQYADQRKDNRMLMEAIEYYKTYLEFDVNDDQLWEYRSAGERSLQRLRFMGHYAQCLPIHNILIKKFPRLPSVRTQLAITYLMIDRLSDAKQVLRETLKLWPDDGLALVHYGFVLKQLDHDYHNATIYLRQGIESEEEGTQTGIFYFQLGEALQRLGKQSEAVKVFRKGVSLKLFPSVFQRSLYNEPNLKAQPFWSAKETTYEKFFKKLQDNWLAIKAEGLNILSKIGYYMNESENLKNKGDWKQFELYARGEQRRENCLQAPITCSLIEQFPAARGCRRGQVKFSVMHPGTHVWPHCGPSNCRLRAHLGLVVPSGTRIRVAEEERTWQEGKFLIFDDSFEHEVWHEGQGIRLVLIVDIWHPELSEHQRRSLFPI